MAKTFTVHPVVEALNDSLFGVDPKLFFDFYAFNRGKESESSTGSKEDKKDDALFRLLIDYIESEELFSPPDANDKQHTTEHNVERFRLHSQSSNDVSSFIPKSVRAPSFNDERDHLLAKIRSCYFEAGIFCEADDFFAELIRKHGTIDHPLSLLSDITNHNIDNEHILEGVLHILSNYDYSVINPIGISIVLAAAVNHSPVIQDLLISCFESWDAVDGIDILEKLELDALWLDQYRNEVVSQLKQTAISA